MGVGTAREAYRSDTDPDVRRERLIRIVGERYCG
jgi:hypothetical protein